MADQRSPPRPDEVVSGPALAEGDASLGALAADRAARWPDRPAVQWRSATGRWERLTWAALDARRLAFARAAIASGVKPGDRAALLSDNRVEMVVAELGLATAGAVSVPIYPDYGSDTLAYCLADSGASLVLCGSSAEQLKLPPTRQAPRLGRVIVLDDHPHPGGSGEPLSRFLAEGTQPEVALPQVSAADLAYLVYTSGTTGRPKGVELSHRNVLSQQAALAQAWDVGERDVFLSYLPWHHCFGAFFERLTALSTGALLALDDSRGRNLDRLIQNLREVKPTVYFSVPRIYQALIGRARHDPSALEALLHPGLRFVFTAAAPLPLPVYRLFEARGVPVLEGWGLTETSPCVTLTPQHGPRTPGVVGWPLPGTSVRLLPTTAVDAPGVGEVTVKGPQVMRGYHRDPEATARVLDEAGWLRTGDLGEWTATGLHVRGRVDGVFKLENGEKVATGEVESRLLAATPLFDQALAVGSGQPHVTAMVWLSQPAVRAWCEARGLPPPAPEEMSSMPELRLAVAEALRAANLLVPAWHERVRRVALLHQPPTLEQGELTPTLKLVRTSVIEHHAELIAALQGRGSDPRILELSRGGDLS